MTKSKVFLIGIYISITALVTIFVFGKSGILDSMTQSQEIVRLVGQVNKSQQEIEEMTKEYKSLVKMKTPNTAFLVGQGRKIRDIVVFQQQSIVDFSEGNSIDAQERKLFFMISLIALVILLAGCIGIIIIYYLNAKHKKNNEEVKDDVVI